MKLIQANFASLLGGLIGSLLLCHSATAQMTVRDYLGLGGYYGYSLMRSDNTEGSTLYRSVIYLEPQGNQIHFYRPDVRDPFGGNARCGGLGCDLEVGDSLGAITLTPITGGWIVDSATGITTFMQNAECAFITGGLGFEIECFLQTGPGSTSAVEGLRSVFSPGS